MSETADIGSLVDAMAVVVDLPIAPQYRAAVIAHLERAQAALVPLLALPLDDELTAAAVFDAGRP